MRFNELILMLARTQKLLSQSDSYYLLGGSIFKVCDVQKVLRDLTHTDEQQFKKYDADLLNYKGDNDL